MAKIKIQAAARLAATRRLRRRRLRAHSVLDEVEQGYVDLIVPVVFKGAHPVTTMSQRDKVDLRLPFPYADIWRTSILGNPMYVSVNADTYQLWCCVYADVRKYGGGSETIKVFVHPVHFGIGERTIKEAIFESYEQVKKLITKWLSTIEA